MNDSYFLVTIVKKELEEQFNRFYQEHGVQTLYGAPAHGTAKRKMLDYLGIEKTEKSVVFSMVCFELMKRLMHELIHDMYIGIPDQGLALAIPMSGISDCLNQNVTKEERQSGRKGGKAMNEYHFSLIVAIVENGMSDIVMDVARKAGAPGGTILHVKGTHPLEKEKFFGISIASEKEMLFIVCRAEECSHIMSTIEKQAGKTTRAQTSLFTVPVEAVAGLRSLSVCENTIV